MVSTPWSFASRDNWRDTAGGRASLNGFGVQWIKCMQCFVCSCSYCMADQWCGFVRISDGPLSWPHTSSGQSQWLGSPSKDRAYSYLTDTAHLDLGGLFSACLTEDQFHAQATTGLHHPMSWNHTFFNEIWTLALGSRPPSKLVLPRVPFRVFFMSL